MPAAIAALAATPASTPSSSASTPAGEPGRFARQLEQAHHEGDGKNAAARPADGDTRSARGGSESRSRSRVAHTDRAPREPRSADHADAADKTAAKEEKAAAKKDGDGGTPAPDGMLPALQPPPAGPAPAATAARGGAEASKAVNALAHDTRADSTRGTAGTAGTDDKAAALRTAGDGGAAAPPASFVLPDAVPASLAAGAAPASAPATAAPAAMHEAHLAAPLASPGFAPALGAQVSLMVKDGVSEAKLQLNPAEMGPITVQIQIDGGSAQVSMAAEQAPTRQALEDALPALAGALRENGLTLTGGGVFEQPRQPQQQPGDDTPSARAEGSGGATADTGLAAVGSAAGAGTPRGVVDLYA